MPSLTIAQLQSLAQQTGLSGNAASVAAAIAMAESGGNTNAHALTIYEDSWGLWQINLRAHPGYSAASMQDPVQNARAMYAISSGGTNWQPWSTYTNGAYRQYLNSGTVTATPVKSGHSNAFPLGQCTWWANQRYHDLTGYYVPWNGNAYQWAQGAQSAGWHVSATPPNGIPSIIVMGPNVQGAGSLGHVGVVEKVNKNRTVTVSNMNWLDSNAAVIQTVSGYPIRQTTITIGPGISFVWATGSGTSPTSLLDMPTAVAKTFKLAPDASVKQFLVSMDEYMVLSSIFDVDTESIQDTAFGVSFTDPAKWLGAVATNAATQMSALLVRTILVILGIYLIVQVIRNFVDTSGSNSDGNSGGANVLPFLQSLKSAEMAAVV